MATAAQVKNFIDTVTPLAVQVCEERGYGNAQAWTCVAQACCESAYGTSGIMMGAKAILGIKADKGWIQAAKYGGKVYSARTKECYDGRTYTDITDTFRAYNSLLDSVRDYFDLIEKPRYAASLKATNVKDCITAIKNGGYATSPTYINTITNIYNQNKAAIEKYKVGAKTMGFQFFNPIKNNMEFAATAIEIATHYKTYYVNGCFGAPMTPANKQRYTQNTSYNREFAAQIMALPPDTFGFDCVCLLKGILWGWCGRWNDVYGGAKYGSNGVGDIGENAMIAKCIGVSTDFKNVQVGEMLWMNGHAGIYIGDGLAVECTPSWKNGVQITAVLNIGKKAGYNGRKWTKHGMLPYFAYVGGSIPQKPSDDLSRYTDEQLADMTINGSFGSGEARKKALGNRYRAVQDIVNARFKAKPDAPKGIVYTVSAGDTLSSIAQKYNTTVQKIVKDNPQITNPNLIYPGQKIGIIV